MHSKNDTVQYITNSKSSLQILPSKRYMRNPHSTIIVVQSTIVKLSIWLWPTHTNVPQVSFLPSSPDLGGACRSPEVLWSVAASASLRLQSQVCPRSQGAGFPAAHGSYNLAGGTVTLCQCVHTCMCLSVHTCTCIHVFSRVSTLFCVPTMLLCMLR